MKKIILFTLSCLLIHSISYAQIKKDDPHFQEIIQLLELWLQAERDFNGIPGISVGIVHDQELVWSKGFGYANLEEKIPASPQTLYSICSISKLFTSIGLMQQRDQGKLELDDKVSQHLPWFTIDQKYPESPPITIEGILTHSAGLPREAAAPYWSPPDFPFPSTEAIQETVDDQETLYPAGKYFQYSNLGLTLAGEIVASSSGESYESYIQKNILDPLGLDHTSTELPKELLGKDLALGYSAIKRNREREKVNFFDAEGIAAAAGFSSNVIDLAKFASWNFRLLETNKEEVLHAHTLMEMQKVHWMESNWKTSWGLGFAVYPIDGKTFVGHGGSCPGYRTILMMQPDEKIGIIFMTNTMGINPGSYARKIYKVIRPVLVNSYKSRTKKLPNKFKKYLGRYDAGPWSSETAIIPWKGKLARIYLPSDDPIGSMTRLKHIENDQFRRIRSDGSLAEVIHFELDQDGKVIKSWQHDNFDVKIEE